MSRLEKLLKRVREELRQTPGVSLRELARKFSVPEGAILETFREKGVSKVRSDKKTALLEEIRTWGSNRLCVHNDWAEIEVAVDLKDLVSGPEGWALEMPHVRVEIDDARVDTIYFVEGPPPASLQFYNRRGRCIFRVVLRTDAALVDRFRAARETFCAS